MNKEKLLTSIRFNEINKDNHVGFVSFIYCNFLFRNIAVWEKINKNGFKCVYPKDKLGNFIVLPKAASVQNKIDEEVTNFIKGK